MPSGINGWLMHPVHNLIFKSSVDYIIDIVDPSCFVIQNPCIKRSVRVISTARLNMSPCVHLQPIKVVVCNYPEWNSYLVASFALRCFQRLSVPDLDTRRCSWRNSRYARGQSDTVLSY